jgi:hypothetical protein
LQPSAFDEHVVGRILEVATPATPWYRRLWHSGPMQLTRELLEAGHVRGTASSAMRDLQADVHGALKNDPGLGSNANSVRAVLPRDARDLTAGSHAWHGLRAAVEQADAEYLDRWAEALSGTHRQVPEFVARRLAAYLLDAGWSATHLHRWTTYRIKHRADAVTLPDLLREARADLSRPAREFAFCVPIARTPPLPRPAPESWLTPAGTTTWRLENVPDARPIRQYGAVLIKVSAADVSTAAEIARRRLSDLSIRFAVGGRRHLEFASDMWVAGRPDPLPTAGSPRRVEVHAFERLERLFDADVPPVLAGALALLAPLDQGSPPAAIVGAWSAVESMLVGPSDPANSVAAGRLALVVAASKLRAELTLLAWAHARAGTDRLAADIDAANTNAAKARLAQQALATGSTLTLTRPTDVWAAERIRPLVTDPLTGVRNLQTVLQRVFLRLYRQRNLIAHGGRIDSTGLEATLRLTAPLVGAGVDRLAHALMSDGVEPLALAATARIRLEAMQPPTASDPGGLVRLLGD